MVGVLYQEASFGRRIRRQVAQHTERGLRRHPLLTLALLLLIVVLLTSVVAVLAVVAILVAVLCAAGVVCYLAGRALLKSHLAWASDQGPVRRIGLRAGAERYLAAVDEFARLLQAALAAGIEARPRDRQLRRTLHDSRRLQASLRDLARNWRGPNAIGAGIYELEDATIALVSYLTQLSRDDWARPSATVLRSQSEALSRRLDSIMLRLRQTDFRAAGASAPVSL